MIIHSSTPNLSFCAYKSSFSKRLESVLQQPSPNLKAKKALTLEFNELFGKIKNKQRLLGRGIMGNHVYRIDDYYVTRSFLSATPGKFHIPKNKFGYSNKYYYGQPVAMFGEIAILRNALKNANEIVVAGGSDNSSYQYVKYIDEFSKLPQYAYDRVAAGFAELNKCKKYKGNYLCYDFCNPNNFIKSGKSIIVVDELFNDMVNSKFPSDMCRMTSALVELRPFDRNEAQLQQIMKKCIIASEKAGLNVCNEKRRGRNFDNLCEILHIDLDVSSLQAEIERLRKNCPGVKNRIKKLEEYLDNAILRGENAYNQ